MVEKAVLAYSSNKSGVMPNSDIFSLSTPQASFSLFRPFRKPSTEASCPMAAATLA